MGSVGDNDVETTDLKDITLLLSLSVTFSHWRSVTRADPANKVRGGDFSNIC